MLKTVRSPFNTLIDLLFPLSCVACGTEGAWLCAECDAGIPAILANHCPFCEATTNYGNTCVRCMGRHFLDGAISCVPYAHPTIQSLIHAWKYNSVQSVTEHLARFVERSLAHARQRATLRAKQSLSQGMSRRQMRGISHIPPLLAGFAVVLEPIPLHPKREKERGYNQASLLAHALAAPSSNRSVHSRIKRAKATSAQAKLTGTDRHTNMAGAFAVDAEKRGTIRGQHIILVDDVITTGSTMDAAARLLKEYGATSVWALTIAYGHPTH